MRIEKRFIDVIGANFKEYNSINELMKNFNVGAVEVLNFWDNNPDYFTPNNFIYAIYRIVAYKLNLQEFEFSLYCNGIYSKFMYNHEIVNNIKELEQLIRIKES